MIAQSKLQENIGVCQTPVPVSVPRNREIGEFQGANENCHPLYIVRGVSALSANKPIPFNTAENIIQAAGFASSLGFPLEYQMTVRWPDGGGGDHETLLRKTSEWQRYHIGRPVFVWARETRSGPHSHILLHIPRHLANRFRKRSRLWLKEAFGLRRLPKGTLSTTKLWKSGDPFENTKKRVRYILKGADPDTRRFFGCENLGEGFVEGKRAGISQGLGEAARRKAGGVLLSGNREPTAEMMAAAMVRDQRRDSNCA